MVLIRGMLADRLLAGRVPREASVAESSGGIAQHRHSLEDLLGRGIWERIQDRVVVDIGCGAGADTVEMAKRGGRLAVGVDIREAVLEQGRELAVAEGVAQRCRFATHWDEPADLVVSVDAFEHFDDPAAILEAMARMIGPDGRILVSFGPTWFHPFGGHMFSMFPWAHLLFDEPSLIRWRNRFRDDGATRFCEVEGGLNGMTIARFEQLVEASPLRLVQLDAIPIRGLGFLHRRWTREFTTALVRAELAPRANARAGI